jgi:phosphoserine phosphatase RsbU/P
MDKQERCVMLVDDEQNILFALKRELHQWARGHEISIVVASSAREALGLLETIGINTAIIVSDLKMPEMKGSDFLLEVKKTWPEITTILLTGYSETEEIVKAVSAGIFSYMLKPWDSDYLLAELEKAWTYGELRRQNTQYTKKLEEELKWAGEMQKTILRPNLPTTTGVEFRVSYRPVPGLYCGGDYYDVISIGSDRYLLLIGDVAGHGVKAAFVTGILKAIIYPEYLRGVIGKNISPADFLGWLNSRMQFEFRSTSTMLITFFAGILDLKAGTFLYANAGQDHPCLISSAGIEELPVSGPAIGSGHTVLYIDKLTRVVKDSVIVLFTDGLAEIGTGVKITQLLQQVPYGDDYHKRILEGALGSSGAREFMDDVTIVTARITQ